ncbi:hypothetical protein A1O3_06981 [Capronia epimyces CBS 606.96]|uniref:DUF1868 domain-containing protein n=1 Tax=Capronia epimyces CBS 606.96 TaxID=1182542 RepID=W9XJJ9_9EURO|nr:uncharacterized protein A1O3_06981 [Capronia epimyces CBS 606.96]EXJ80697.1 hypothetical protein A1O3_06981 [Capronia epimyces CBS 606.96]
MTTTNTTTDIKSTITLERPTYPLGVPFKFSPDGLVQRYPGNTTLCHIPLDSPLISGLRTIYNRLGSHATLSRLLRLLPPESWHMTVLDCVCEIQCEPEMWPTGMKQRPIHEWTSEFSKSLRHVGNELDKAGLAPPYRMRIRGFDAGVIGIGLEVEGVSVEEEKRMRRLRDKLADAIGFRAPRHETYTFHISIAYLLRHIDDEDRNELDRVLAEILPKVKMDFDLGAVEFCTFENMCAYPRVFYLGGEEGQS